MKISINDQCGSSLKAVVNLDGSPAVVKQDYIIWEGEYYKNGKWSYYEGGIGIKNGAFSVQQKSTHSSANNNITLTVVQDNIILHKEHIGRIMEMAERPNFEGDFKEILCALFEEHLKTAPQQTVEDAKARWSENASFF